MSSIGSEPDDQAPGNQPDGSFYNLFPDSSQPGLLGGQYATMMASAPPTGMAGVDAAAMGENPDVSYDGTGLPPSVTLAPNLPQQGTLDSSSSPNWPLMLDPYTPPTVPDLSQAQNRPATGNIDINKLVTAMDRNALPQSKGICATNSRLGLEAGGLDTTGHPIDAKDYGPFLVTHGAAAVSSDNYAPQAGDVAVFEGTDKHKYGHIEVFDGNQWVSDFMQRGYSPYKDKTSTPPSTVYRFPEN